MLLKDRKPVDLRKYCRIELRANKNKYHADEWTDNLLQNECVIYLIT